MVSLLLVREHESVGHVCLGHEEIESVVVVELKVVHENVEVFSWSHALSSHVDPMVHEVHLCDAGWFAAVEVTFEYVKECPLVIHRLDGE